MKLLSLGSGPSFLTFSTFPAGPGSGGAGLRASREGDWETSRPDQALAPALHAQLRDQRRFLERELVRILQPFYPSVGSLELHFRHSRLCALDGASLPAICPLGWLAWAGHGLRCPQGSPREQAEALIAQHDVLRGYAALLLSLSGSSLHAAVQLRLTLREGEPWPR